MFSGTREEGNAAWKEHNKRLKEEYIQMATEKDIAAQLVNATNKKQQKEKEAYLRAQIEQHMQGKGYATPEEMMEAWQNQMVAATPLNPMTTLGSNNITVNPFTYTWDLPKPHVPVLKESDQTPRQWNLTTIKRCVVTRGEYQHFGSVEAVLKKKGFPTSAPDNGDLLISWFDQKEGCAYYELCRVQDQKEMMKYMHEMFEGQQVQEEGGRSIYFD